MIWKLTSKYYYDTQQIIDEYLPGLGRNFRFVRILCSRYLDAFQIITYTFADNFVGGVIGEVNVNHYMNSWQITTKFWFLFLN